MKEKMLYMGMFAAVVALFGANAYSKTLGSIIVPAPTNGNDGLSAYQIWLDAGNTGTKADFLASLKGADGTSVKIKGTVPTCAALNSLTNVSAGDIYLVTGDNNMGYIYDGTSFPNCPGNGIQIQGPKGQACLSTLTTQACGPDLTKKCPVATRSGTVYTKTDCNGTNPTDDVIYNGDDGDDICDNVENPATSVKTYTKTYTAHTASLPGYVTLTQTMCNNTTNTTNYQDSCVPIIPRTNQNICSAGTYMECTAQNDGTVYNVCKPKDTDDADTVFTALKDKLSKNVTFATETVNDVESFVLKEGSNTVAVLATKSELKGAPGTPACNTTLTKSVITNPVTNKKSVTVTAKDCNSNTLWTETVEDGVDGAPGTNGTPGQNACTPVISKSVVTDPVTSKKTVTITAKDCNDSTLWTETVEDGTDGTNGSNGAAGVGVCDNVADTATANKNTVSVYTAGTATTIGYMTHTYTKCNGNTETSIVEDSCTQVVDKRTSGACSGAYMVCKNQQAGTEYNVCKPISGQDISPFSSAISSLASELDQKASKNTLNNYVKTDGTNLPSGVITTSNLAQNNIVTTSALNSAVNTAVGAKAVSFGGQTMTMDDVVELLSSAVTCAESTAESVNTITCTGTGGSGLNLSRSKVQN